LAQTLPRAPTLWRALGKPKFREFDFSDLGEILTWDRAISQVEILPTRRAASGGALAPEPPLAVSQSSHGFQQQQLTKTWHTFSENNLAYIFEQFCAGVFLFCVPSFIFFVCQVFCEGDGNRITRLSLSMSLTF